MTDQSTPIHELIRYPKPRDERCSRCGRKLARMIMVPGSWYSIRCPKCSYDNVRQTPINHTSVLIFASLIERMNGNTPENAMRLLMDCMVKFSD